MNEYNKKRISLINLIKSGYTKNPAGGPQGFLQKKIEVYVRLRE
jgi:hypothetical protein